jgi:hypothetical protein
LRKTAKFRPVLSGNSGEGMPQINQRRRRSGRAIGCSGSRDRAKSRAFPAGAALVLLLVTALPSYGADAKGGDDTNAGAWNKFLHSIGLGKPVDQRDDEDIKYIDRSPLVVPQTRDLPPPEQEAAPGANWPKDAGNRKRHKSKDALASPAPGQQPYVQVVPNPQVESKVWYKPQTWFSKEEYGTFVAEPARTDLTDPPAGYRTPSPYQPYGIGPDKKDRPKTARDGTPVPAATASGTPGATAQSTPTQGTPGAAAPSGGGSSDAAASPQAPARQ